jgi:hypothetical protein
LRAAGTGSPVEVAGCCATFPEGALGDGWAAPAFDAGFALVPVNIVNVAVRPSSSKTNCRASI